MQIGSFLRVFIVEMRPELPGGDGVCQKLACVNPVIKGGIGTQTRFEGCLSIPGQRAKVTRAKTVLLEYQDVHGEKHELEATGLLAQAIQHENDHLDGIFFPHRISSLQREMIRRHHLKRG